MSGLAACYRPPQQPESTATDRVLNVASAIDTPLGAAQTARTVAEAAGAPLSPLSAVRTAALRAAGLGFGATNMWGGVRNLRDGNTEQGVGDLASGVFSTGVTLMEMAGRADPRAAVLATLANLGAYGTTHARDAGWYGRDPGAAGGPPVMEGNASRPLGFAESVGVRASSGYRAGSDWAGGGWLGSIVGSGAAIATGADQLVVNSVNAVGAGGLRMIGAPPQAPACPDPSAPEVLTQEQPGVPQIRAPRRGSLGQRTAQAAAMQALGTAQRPEDLQQAPAEVMRPDWF